MKTRIEKDSIGHIEVPSHVLWGAQTERSRQNFTIGHQEMPSQLILAIVLIKKAAAFVNTDCGLLSQEKRDAIARVCDEILAGELLDQFPLVIWQTGSGTQTNMNVNEVIANRAKELTQITIHPNDDVNKSQSTNDVFPSAIYIAATLSIHNHLLPSIQRLHDVLHHRSKESFQDFLYGTKWGFDGPTKAVG